jgi:hypothetical protein
MAQSSPRWIGTHFVENFINSVSRRLAVTQITQIGKAASVVLDVAIPALIYALTRIAAAIYIDCHAGG